jgi:hypothetical protein
MKCSEVARLEEVNEVEQYGEKVRGERKVKAT